MDKALAVKEEAQISMADVKKFIAPNATDKELFMFMGISKSYGLNPLKREIHFVKYGNSPASIIVGYEIYLKRAERTGKLDGWKCWIEDTGKPTSRAVIEIYRKDQQHPVKWEVFDSEFNKQQSTWKTMPSFMLKKVAIAQGFRLAFPDDLGGMPYIPEEMPHDKGGGSSEVLAAEVVEARADEPDVTDPIIPDAPGGDPSPETAIETDPRNFTTLKAKDGFDRGQVVMCPDKPKGKNLTDKKLCNECQKSMTCTAWEGV